MEIEGFGDPLARSGRITIYGEECNGLAIPTEA